jgi:hypothetical protein
MTPIDTDLILLTEANRLFPGRGGKHVHKNTVIRWALSGVRGVKLRTTRVGGRRFTCQQWASEFLAALNGEKAPPVARPDLSAALRARGL